MDVGLGSDGLSMTPMKECLYSKHSRGYGILSSRRFTVHFDLTAEY